VEVGVHTASALDLNPHYNDARYMEVRLYVKYLYTS